MIYNRIIKIQKLIGNQWTDYMTIHAAVNKAAGGEELEAGSFQSQETLQFDVRFCLAVAAIRKNTQLYQVVYDGDSHAPEAMVQPTLLPETPEKEEQA